MQKVILNVIKEYGPVTLAKIEKEVPGFKGNLEWYFKYDVIWPSCSKEAIAAMNYLLVNRLIKLDLCSPMEYLIDGAIPNIQTPFDPMFGSTKLRWIPLLFSIPNLI